MSKAADAIRFLECQTQTADDALRELNVLSETLTSLGLFQHYFPVEFAKQRIVWGQQATLVQAACDFTELVSRHLFPCFVYCDMDEGQGDLTEIVFEAPFPAWFDDSVRDPTELGVLEEIILVAAGYIERRGVEIEWSKRQVSFDTEYLDRVCGRWRSPLRWLPLAVKFFLKDTGNMWCDVSQEELNHCSDWPTWSLETVEWLKKDWAKALEISRQVGDLEHWIGEKPENRQQVEHILRRATKQRQRVQAQSDGRPLFEAMDEWIDDEWEIEPDE